MESKKADYSVSFEIQSHLTTIEFAEYIRCLILPYSKAFNIRITSGNETNEVVIFMKRTEKDFGVCMMDLYARSCHDRLPRTSAALKSALQILITELREREDREFVEEPIEAFDRNGDLLK